MNRMIAYYALKSRLYNLLMDISSKDFNNYFKAGKLAHLYSDEMLRTQCTLISVKVGNDIYSRLIPCSIKDLIELP